ncbi:putative LRR containing protein [Trachipleistophora hominis]|uniref:Putative LRR containing protein n=1 Tax=Trachipleistophora hominis TaxID=72359 RepID=L7JVR9_TRAHO|nr:putative LRR containing protein [Trachipleistophora hominis]
MLVSCYIIINLGIVVMEDVDLKEKNTKNINRLDLRLYGLCIMGRNQFRPFFKKINVLNVMPLVKVNDKEIQVRRRIKRLITVKINSRTRKEVCKDYLLEEYFDHLLNLLSQYIDFGSVEEIKILDQDTEKLVDPRYYSPNR